MRKTLKEQPKKKEVYKDTGLVSLDDVIQSTCKT